MVITNAQQGNFQLDGAYIQTLPPQAITPPGPQTNLLAIVGGASWGPKNTPVPFNNAASCFAAFGASTSVQNSLVREALSAMPEGQNFLGVRVTDGTDAAATILVKDNAAGTVLTLTANYTGSAPNGSTTANIPAATARVDLISGTATVSPVFAITITFPNANPQVFSPVVGYATLGSTYDAPTFKANAIAAINGTAPNSVKSPYFTATTGASIVIPLLGTLASASGGLDGATGITSSTLVGTDGTTGRTGMYALRAAVAGGTIVLASLIDTAQFANVGSFCQQEGCIGLYANASGTSTQSAVNAKVTSSLSNDYMLNTMDWTNYQDQFQGQLVLASPMGKIAGIVSSLPPWLSPSNKPYTGAVGPLSTERSVLGPLSTAEAGQRESNGIMWLAMNPGTPRGPIGLPHGLTSSGKNISDIRMQNYIAYALNSIMGQFVGEMQTTLAKDPTRAAARAAVNRFLQGLVDQRQIGGYSNITDNTNNSATTIQQGFLISNISVQTLSGVRFALAALQVGNTVVINVNTLGG